MSFTLILLISASIYCFLYFFYLSFFCVLSDNLSLGWAHTYCYILLIFTYFVPSMILSSVPFNFILGSYGFLIFFASFVGWGISLLGSSSYLIRFYNLNSLSVVGLFLFDSFVNSLRPVTLTLRIFINVSLGHFLILMVHVSHPWALSLVWAVEMFVYLVQIYVFMTLSKSYLDTLLVYISSSMSHLRWGGLQASR